MADNGLDLVFHADAEAEYPRRAGAGFYQGCLEHEIAFCAGCAQGLIQWRSCKNGLSGRAPRRGVSLYRSLVSLACVCLFRFRLKPGYPSELHDSAGTFLYEVRASSAQGLYLDTSSSAHPPGNQPDGYTRAYSGQCPPFPVQAGCPSRSYRMAMFVPWHYT